MDRAQRVRISELNPHLMCVLCGGYYVDATTIIECLHSFCKTCIVRYLESSKYCPICDVQVHKTKPLLNIRADRTLQELVYKLVPGLYTREVLQRREFYRKNAASAADVSSSDEDSSYSDSSSIFSAPDARSSAVGTDTMSISLELSIDGKPVVPSKGRKSAHHSDKILQRRYLMCPASFTIGHLKKFIRMKLDISTQLEVDVFHIDEPLSDSYALMDIAYIYSWFKTVPLPLYFSVFDKPVKPTKRLKVQEVFTEGNYTSVADHKMPDLNPNIEYSTPKKSSDDPDLSPTSSKITAKRKSQTKEESSVSREKIPKCSLKESTTPYRHGKSPSKSLDKNHSKQKLSPSKNAESALSQQVVDAVDSELLSTGNQSSKSNKKLKPSGKQTSATAHKTSSKKIDKQCESDEKHTNGNSNSVHKCSPSKLTDSADSKSTNGAEDVTAKSTNGSEKEHSVQEPYFKSKHRHSKENVNQTTCTTKDKITNNDNNKSHSKVKDKRVDDDSKLKDSPKEHVKETSDSDNHQAKDIKDSMVSKTKDSTKPKDSKIFLHSRTKDVSKGQKTNKHSQELKDANTTKAKESNGVHVKEAALNHTEPTGIEGKKDVKDPESLQEKKAQHKNTKHNSGASDDIKKCSGTDVNDTGIQANGQSTSSMVLTPLPKDQMDDTKSNGCKISTSSSGKSIVVSIPKHLLEKSNSDKEKKKKKKDNHHHHKHHKKHRRQSKEDKLSSDIPGKSGVESAEESVKSGSTPSVSSSPSSDRGLPEENGSKQIIPLDPAKRTASEEQKSDATNEDKKSSNKPTQQREPVLQQLQDEMEKQKEKAEDSKETHDLQRTTPTAVVKEKALEAISKIKRDPRTSPAQNTFSQIIKKKHDTNPNSKGKETIAISSDAKTTIKTSNTGTTKSTTTLTEGTNGNTKKSILSKITSPRLIKTKQGCKSPVSCATVSNLQQGKIFAKFGQTNSADKHKMTQPKMPMTVDLTRSERPDAPKVSMPWMSLSTLAEAGRKIQESANTALGRTSPAKPPPGRNWIDDRQKSNGIQMSRSPDSSESATAKQVSAFTEPYSTFGSPALPKGIKTYSKKDKLTYKHQNVFNQSPTSHNYEGAFKTFLGCQEDTGSPPKKPKYSLPLNSPNPVPETGSSSSKYLASPKKDRTPTSPQPGLPRHLHGHKVIGQLQMVYETIQKPAYPEVCRKSPKPTSPQKSPSNILDKEGNTQAKGDSSSTADYSNQAEGSKRDDDATYEIDSSDKVSQGKCTSVTNETDGNETTERVVSDKTESPVISGDKNTFIAVTTEEKADDKLDKLESSQSTIEENNKTSEKLLTEKIGESDNTDEMLSNRCDKISEKPCGSPNPCESSFSATHLTAPSPLQGGHNVCGAASPPNALSPNCIPCSAPESPKHSPTCSGSSSQTVTRVVASPRAETRDQSHPTCLTTCSGHTSGNPNSSGGRSPQNNNLSAASSIDVGVHCDQCHSASTPTASETTVFEKGAPQDVPLNLHKPRTQSETNLCPVQTDGTV